MTVFTFFTISSRVVCGMLLLTEMRIVHAESQILEVGMLPQSLNYPVASIEFVGPRDGWAHNMEALWRTRDGGKTWDIVTIPLHNLSACHFESPDLGWILVSSDQPPALLYRTSDGGKTWLKQSPLPAFNPIFFMPGGFVGWVGGLKLSNPPPQRRGQGCIFPPNPSLLQVQLFHTADAGKSWSRQVVPNSGGCPLSSIRFQTLSEGIAVAGHHIFHTRDGGTTWSPSTYTNTCRNRQWIKTESSEDIHMFSYDDKQTWLGSSSGFVLKSADGGETWCVEKIPGEIGVGGGFGEFGSLYFVTPKHGYILGIDHHIHETQDGGASWSTLSGLAQVDAFFCGYGNCWAASERLYRLENAFR